MGVYVSTHPIGDRGNLNPHIKMRFQYVSILQSNGVRKVHCGSLIFRPLSDLCEKHITPPLCPMRSAFGSEPSAGFFSGSPGGGFLRSHR